MHGEDDVVGNGVEKARLPLPLERVKDRCVQIDYST